MRHDKITPYPIPNFATLPIVGAVAGAFWGVPNTIRSQVEALLPADMKTSFAVICKGLV